MTLFTQLQETIAKLPQAIAGIPEKLNLKTLLESASLQRIPFGEEVPASKTTTGSNTSHSDLSEIDSFILNGSKVFATLPDKANPARLNLYNRKNNGKLEISRVISLVDQNGNPYPEGSIDTEAIRFFEKNGKIFALITSEGESRGYDKAKDKNTSPEEAAKITAEQRKRDPKIYLAELVLENGVPQRLQVRQEIDTPAKFRHQVKVDENDPKKTIDLKGPRANGSFESIAISKDGKTAFLITEFPLVEDGEMATSKGSSFCRCLEINLSTGTTSQYCYKLEATPLSEKAKNLLASGHKIANDENGVVSIVADPSKNNSYFVMERSFFRVTDKDDPKKTLLAENSIRIYRVDIATDTREISSLDNLSTYAHAAKTAVRKEIYLDFQDLEKLFSSQGTRADNFEGMTLNYNAAEKCWELICVSDNNLNKIQGDTQIVTIMLH